MSFINPIKIFRAFIFAWSLQALSVGELIAKSAVLDPPVSSQFPSSVEADGIGDVLAQKKKRKRRKKRKSKKRRRKKKKATKKSTARKAKPNALLYALPLGVGQFYNGAPILGGVFAAAQLGGFVFGLTSSNEASAISEDLAAFINQRNDEQQTLEVSEREAHVEETRAYAASEEDRIAAAESSAMIGFVVSFFGYAGSVAHAFIAGPKSSAGIYKPLDAKVLALDRTPALYSILPGKRFQAEDTHELWSMRAYPKPSSFTPLWKTQTGYVGLVFRKSL